MYPSFSTFIMKHRLSFVALLVVTGISAGFAGSYIQTKLFANTPLKAQEIKAQETEAIQPEGTQPFIPSWQTGYAPPHPAALSGPVDFVAASSAAIPSVVYITTVQTQQENMLDLFFFGTPNSKQVSSGSGVVFSANGYIVTNNHVINGAETIEVVHQKKTYTAKVIGADPSTDLALLKIEGQNFPAVKIADSRKTAVGEWVLAIGNPFNLRSTVTAGIISAKGRNINLLNAQFPIESFIQTDAAINPGNSGGALVNTRGELVGINTAIFSKTGSYTGYGFAVPSDIVKKVVEDLIKYGTVQKAFAGATVAEIDSKVAERLDQADYKGVVITDISQDGAASKGGLKADDVILKINGQAITGKGVFDEEISYYNPGDKVTVNYRRGKNLATTAVTLTNTEGTTELVKRTIYASQVLGADLETLSKLERERLKTEGGIRISRIYGNGIVRRLGLAEGFIIVAINQEVCKEPRDVERLLSNARGRTIVEGIDQTGRASYYQFGF